MADIKNILYQIIECLDVINDQLNEGFGSWEVREELAKLEKLVQEKFPEEKNPEIFENGIKI